MILKEEQLKSLHEAALPLMQWLNNNCHPHCSAIVDSERTELVEGLAAVLREQKPIDKHISVLTAELKGRLKTAALKYCHKYGCASLEDLKYIVMLRERPAGVSVTTKFRLHAAIKMKLTQLKEVK